MLQVPIAKTIYQNIRSCRSDRDNLQAYEAYAILELVFTMGHIQYYEWVERSSAGGGRNQHKFITPTNTLHISDPAM